MRFPFFLFTILLALLLLGCITIQYVHKLERNGDSLLTMNANVSALEGMGNSMGESSAGSFEEQQAESCKEKIELDPGLTCTYADGILTVSKHLSASDGLYDFKTEKEFLKIRYTFTLDTLPDIDPSESDITGGSGIGTGQQAGDLNLPFTDPKSAEQAEQMKQFLTITYVVEMPGTIVSAEGATEVMEGRATFDVLERMQSGEDIGVVSEEQDLTMLLLI